MVSATETDLELFTEFAERIVSSLRTGYSGNRLKRLSTWFFDTVRQPNNTTHSMYRRYANLCGEFLSRSWFDGIDHGALQADLQSCKAELAELEDLFETMQLISQEDDPTEAGMRYFAERIEQAQVFTVPVIVRELAILRNTYGDKLSFSKGGDEQFGDTHYGTARGDGWRIAIEYEPVTFTESGISVSFDGFYGIIFVDKIVEALASGGGGIDRILRVSAINPNLPQGSDSVLHPHVDDGLICMGTAKAGICDALRNGLFSDAFILLGNLLNTYNPEGPFVHINGWYGNLPRCPICSSAITPDEGYVQLARGGQNAHRSCAVEREEGVWVNPNDILSCASCSVRINRADAHTHYTEDMAQQSSVCGTCHENMLREEELARQGGYRCPLCETEYEHADVEAHRVVIGYRDYGCTSCCRDNGDGTWNIPGRDGQHELREDSNSFSNVTRRPFRPTHRPAVLATCRCGATVGEGTLRSCTFTDTVICDHCDPEGYNLSPDFFSDTAYSDSWMVHTFQDYLDDMSKDYIELLSMYEIDDITVQAAIVATLVKRLQEGQRPPRAGELIETKLAWWNSASEPFGIIIAAAAEGELHDQEVIRVWQREADSGVGWARQRLEEYIQSNRTESAAEHAAGEAGERDTTDTTGNSDDTEVHG